MFDRFTEDARRVVEAAGGEAVHAGSTTVEAEHLLLALARGGHPALAERGVDGAVIEAALRSEREASLAAVGVTWNAPASRRAPGAPRYGTSAKLALQRALPAAVEGGDRRITADHVLVGVLTAKVERCRERLPSPASSSGSASARPSGEARPVDALTPLGARGTDLVLA